jgi:serine/threonine protein kinase
VHEDKELGKGQWNRVLAGSIAGKPVAVKVSKGTTAEDKARIDSDLAVLRKLRHEFIVQLTHPVHYAMECCFGDILTHVADLSKAGLSKEDSRRLGLTFFVQLLRAVDYLHNQKNIAHCDLKPQNAMIGDDGCLRVVDFGSARSTVAVGTPTEYTPFYGAPEFDSPLLTQSGLAGCDIWSLGCVLFRVLNGIELGATMPKEAQASVNSFFAHLRGPYCDQRRQMNVPADKTSFDHLLHFMLMPPTKIKFGTGEDLSDTLMPNPARFDIRQVLNHPAIKNFKPYLPVELKQLLGRRLAAISYAESSGA